MLTARKMSVGIAPGPLGLIPLRASRETPPTLKPVANSTRSGRTGDEVGNVTLVVDEVAYLKNASVINARFK
jgi:hypothetical protein